MEVFKICEFRLWNYWLLRNGTPPYFTVSAGGGRFSCQPRYESPVSELYPHLKGIATENRSFDSQEIMRRANLVSL